MSWHAVRQVPIRGRAARVRRIGWVVLLSAWVCGLLIDVRVLAADDEQAQRREFLPRSIPRHRRLKETLAAIDQFQVQGKASEALKAVQWILDQPFDTLHFSEGQPSVSVKGIAEARLKSFPAEWRQQYERTHGQEARGILDEAKQRQEESLAVEVLRRFPVGAVAEEAAIWLALRWLDRGEPSLAAAVLLPKDGRQIALRELSSSRLSVAYRAAEAAGNWSAATLLRQELGERTDSVALAALQRPPKRSPEPHGQAAPEERLNVHADREDPAASRDAIPVLNPRWTTELPGRNSSPHLTTVLDAWRGHLQETNLTPVVPNLPLVVRGQLILRNYEGICGIDLISGRSLWTFPCESSLSTWVDEAARSLKFVNDAGSPFPPETLQWWFGSNTQMGYLSSDGIRIYLVDSLATPTVRQAGRQDPFQTRPDEPHRVAESCKLLALNLPTRSEEGKIAPPQLAWSYGRSPQLAGKEQTDRYFLGPPLPNAGRLLCLAETDREIRLMALQPETGAVLWEQPVAAADRAAVYDGERAFLACQPVVSGGLILCPTQVGVLSAVDAVTGYFRWAYYDHDLPPDPAKRPRGTVTARGRSGFASRTMVHGTRVVHLPTSSSFVHCLESETGRLIWMQPRRRSCSIAQITDDVVVLLEDQACRAVKLSDGTDVWTETVGPIAGTGLRLGTEYLIPLTEGRFALLDSATGRKQFWQPSRSNISLGNLMSCGDVVLSVGPEQVSAFPQVQSARRLLTSQSAALNSADRLSLHADLKLSEGNLAEAEPFLDAALRESVPLEQQAELQHVLRALLYQRLAADPDRSRPILSRLKELAQTPEERGRYLARQAQLAVMTNDLPLLRQTLLEFVRLPVEVTFPSAEETGWRQSASACCRQMLSEAKRDHPEFVQSFHQELQDRLAKHGDNAEALPEWRFVLRVCGEDASLGALRSGLAKRLEDAGQWHAAELLWLQNRRTEEPRLAGEAQAGFVRIWNRAGWPRDAASALGELTGPYGDVPVGPGISGREFAEQLPAQHPARQWQARNTPPAGRFRSALIHGPTDLELPGWEALRRQGKTPQTEERNPGRYGEFVRPIALSEPQSGQVLIRVAGQQSKLVVVDKTTSQPLREWNIPMRQSHPWPNTNADQGHFLPLGVPGELRGYSLLHLGEDGPVWSQRPRALEGRRAIPTIGPGGPTFVTFQAQNLLIVCDPWDGSLLWQRDTLEPQSGLYADPRSGIAGDERCLVVFGPDRFSYVLYDTLTGRVLRSGRLDLEARHARWAYGRKLFTVSQGRGQWQVKVWDPWEDRWELEESMGDRNTAIQCTGSPEIAWLTPEGELRVYHMVQSRRTLNVRLPQEELEGFNALRVFSEGDRCYVNLWRNQQAAQTRDYNYPLQDALAPWVPQLRDDLYAIDRRTGRILWKRTFPNRTVLQVDAPGLPFLVLASMIRDAQDGNQRSLLVEVIDADTGELLGRNDHLPLDRVINTEYDGVEATLRIVGQHSVVELQFLTDPAVGVQRGGQD